MISGSESALALNVNTVLADGYEADFVAHKRQYPGDTQQDICQAGGVPFGQFNQAFNHHAPFKAWHLVAMARAGFTGGIRALCAAAGGMFVLMPRAARDATVAMSRTALLRLMKESHEALEVNFRAHSDGVITKAERAECLLHLDQMIAAADVARQRIAELPVKESAHA